MESVEIAGQTGGTAQKTVKAKTHPNKKNADARRHSLKATHTSVKAPESIPSLMVTIKPSSTHAKSPALMKKALETSSAPTIKRKTFSMSLAVFSLILVSLTVWVRVYNALTSVRLHV